MQSQDIEPTSVLASDSTHDALKQIAQVRDALQDVIRGKAEVIGSLLTASPRGSLSDAGAPSLPELLPTASGEGELPGTELMAEEVEQVEEAAFWMPLWAERHLGFLQGLSEKHPGFYLGFYRVFYLDHLRLHPGLSCPSRVLVLPGPAVLV